MNRKRGRSEATFNGNGAGKRGRSGTSFLLLPLLIRATFTTSRIITVNFRFSCVLDVNLVLIFESCTENTEYS